MPEDIGPPVITQAPALQDLELVFIPVGDGGEIDAEGDLLHVVDADHSGVEIDPGVFGNQLGESVVGQARSGR